MNEEIKYIPYGLDEISQLDLMTSLADGIEPYLNSKRWARKEKNRKVWLSAYLDIINLGLVGASNESGVWRVNHSGNIDMDSKSDLEKEMYGDAAYYIRQQMSKMTPRAKEEDKKEEKKDKYDFINDFLNHLLTKYYGNNKELYLSPTEGWDSQDERDPKTGLRTSITNRKAALINALTSYKELLEDKYDFEGSPFSGKDDVIRKIDEAIGALNSPDLKDDNEKLHALGLGYNQFFSNGGNDVYETDTNGNPVTYLQYYDNLNKITKLKVEAKAIAAKKAAEIARANYWDGFKSYDFSKFHGRPLKSEESNIEYLSNLFAKDKWSGDEASLIVQAFKLAALNGKLVPLSKEEISKLNPSIWKNRAKYLRKIDGVDGLYYDTYSRLYKKFYKNGQTSQTSFLDILDLNSPEALKEKQNKQAAVNMNTPLSLMTEWTPEMKKEIEAIAWDAASILNPEAFSGSAMALNAARLRGEANPNRSTLETVLDYGTAGLGGILGFGDLLVTGKLGYKLYQLGKSIGSVSKFAGILGAGFGAVGAFEARDSIAKIANPDSLTPQDLENIAYGLMGLIGLKSFAKARNKQTIGKQANPTTTEYNITVKDKNNKTHEIKIDEATAKEILLVRTLGKKKETVDSEILNMPKIKESIQKYKEANPTKNLEIEGASIVNDSKSVFGASGKNKLVTSNQVKNPNAPEYVPVGNKWYNPFGYIALGNNRWGYYLGGGWQRKAWENAAPEHSPRGLWLRAKEFWNPEPKVKNEVSSTKPSTENSNTTGKKTWAEIEKEPKKWSQSAEAKEYKEMLKGNYSNNAIQGGTHKIGDLTIDVDIPRPGATNGFAEVTFSNGNKQTIKFDNLKQLQELIAKIVKERRVQIDSSGKKTKVDVKEMSKILKSLKARGFLKQGGQINLSSDNIIENFIKNYNI